MIRSFSCASCSAPLEFEGKATQRCEFCGATVIVPPELYSVDQTSTAEKVRAAVEFRPDPKVLKATGAVVGGSILISFLLPIIFVLIGGSAALYFALNSTSRSKETPVITTPADGSGEKAALTEILRIGGKGDGAGMFTDNRHVAVDGKGRIYSSNYSPIVVKVFDPSGKFLNHWAADAGPNLYDLAADRDGTIYLATNKGLFQFDGESGKPLNRLAKISPRGIALRSNGDVVVSDSKNISIFDRKLKLRSTLKDASLTSGSCSRFDKVATDGSKLIYALDASNSDVCKFASDGTFVGRFASGVSSPNAIAISKHGRVFISNTSSIHVFDENGSPITEIRSSQAFGLAFDGEDSLYIADRPFVTKNRIDF